MIQPNRESWASSRVKFEIDADVETAQAILSILYALEIDVHITDVDEFDVDRMEGISAVLWKLAWHIWGDEGIFEIGSFWKLTERWREMSRRSMWNLRHIAYRDTSDYDTAKAEYEKGNQ